ncbi:hypothetical protein [Burkholderia sp. Ac-20379]|uniref:hypothetical protein n=1 Tax=Burkholderia sp. Ac-20379 TaxID=2703900 RepID=UPI001981AC69|nr:hypothetical protein [Burkholderia sp. Ac-20379]MBN3725574.1 hypothetical protein [Burkholderia sp. Ac-20379]
MKPSAVSRKISLLCAALFSVAPLVAMQPAQAAGHILIDLHVKKDDLVNGGHGKRNLDEFAEGGQFEVLLKPASVPVTAPMCRKQIFARMPYTDPDDAHASAVNAAKKALFDKFLALRDGRIDSVDVTVDAGPYGEQTSSSPRVVKLSYCNVFFPTPKI